ncbi:MAG: tetratricopeptide repeat protein [Terracidiphilus sp.]
MKRVFQIALLAALVAGASAEVPRDGLGQADAALQAGEADRALAVLKALPSSAEAHNLRCRVYFTLERWDDAASECDQAVRLDGQSAKDHLWLGRALGEKADNASFFSAYNLAKRARSEFEQAVNLDPHDGEALTDLGEFYSSAPGVVGGGNDKAQALLPALERVDKARAHILLGRIAESHKDYGTAEREFKQAAATSDHPAFAWMTLASFYRKHEHWDEMEQTVEMGYRAAQHDRRAGVALYNGASVLSRGKRNLALAAKMLEEYLATYPRTEEAPAFVAYTRLAKLKAQLGDKNGAWQARTDALNLAHDYKPALGLTF